MTVLTEKLVDQVLLLPREERAALVERLLQSLNVPTRADIDRLWAVEAERRVGEIEEGQVAPIDGEKIFREIRDRIA